LTLTKHLAQGTALLRQVFEHLYRPEHLYEHHWFNGDLVIWDNPKTKR
jgi:taurine dioxygenase